MKANHKVLLEEMLLSAKGDTISFLYERKSQTEKDVLELKDRLAALDEADVLDEALHEDISNQLKLKIAILAKDKFFQREVDWVRCGERLSPTLVNLEKSNGNQKFIPQLYVTDPDGNQTLTQDQPVIEEALVTNYEELYEAHKHVIRNAKSRIFFQMRMKQKK